MFKYSNVFGNVDSEIVKYLNFGFYNVGVNDIFKSYN